VDRSKGWKEPAAPGAQRLLTLVEIGVVNGGSQKHKYEVSLTSFVLL
jgi:hypothetical protein